MNDVPEAVLHDCLDFMEQGESIEQILGRYPELAETLRPFLETAVQLTTLAPQPSLVAKQQSQRAFLAHAEGLKTTPIQPSPWYRLRQLLLPLVSLAVVLILFVTTAVSVSASAIPGDALYSVKRLVETIRLNQTSNSETAMALMEQYRQERIREVEALLRTGRSAEVTFEGEIIMIQPEEWTVATINVLLTAETSIGGKPQLGEIARVNGRTENSLLVASRIEVLTGSAATPETEPPPEPTQVIAPTATTTATATATQEPTTEPTEEPTVKPTSTQTTTATPQPTATITPSPTPTATPSPMPTSPPANDNDGNDNDNDGNDNDNDGNSNDNDNDNDDDDDSNDNDDDNHNDDGEGDSGNDTSGGGSDDNEHDDD